MKKALCWALILPCTVASPAWGAAGELRPVSMDLRAMAAAGFEPQSISTRSLVAAPEGCGTVSSQAKVATLTAGASRITVALDSTRADAKQPDLVRFDFTGKCRFKGAPTVPLKRGLSPRYRRFLGAIAKGDHYHFGPAMLKVRRGGTTMPVCVRGEYFVGTGVNTWRSFSVTLGAAAEGSCRFGGKVYGVRVADGNSNLRFGDGPSVRQKDGRVVNTPESRGPAGDAVLIDTTSDTFKTAGLRVSWGQVVRVDGAWYHLSVSEGGSKIAARPTGVRTGEVLIPADKWSVTLIGTKHVLRLSGGAEPVGVPADEYVAANYEVTVAGNIPAKPWRLSGGGGVMSGGTRAKVFNVKAGEVTKAPVGEPLSATVTVSQSKGTVSFNALVTDASGVRVSTLYGPKGRPPAPKMILYNDKRERVYSTTLKYG